MSSLTTPKERPILFSGAMVRALLAGTKTQTRRIIKPQPTTKPSQPTGKFDWYGWNGHGWWAGPEDWAKEMVSVFCPYGGEGDRLYVRETFAKGKKMEEGYVGDEDFIIYKATDEDVQWYDGADDCPIKTPWKPSIHMPRAASRLLLEITAVRCERLQDISESDAVAEGATCCVENMHAIKQYDDVFPSARQHYHKIWASINGPDSWAANPWVWVVEFRVISEGKEAVSAA